MSEILESAKTHFRSKLANGLKKIEVPEWKLKDGKPSVIFYRESINFLQQEKILKLSDENKKGEAIIEALIQRALNADGERIFKSIDRTELMRQVDPDVISQIVSSFSHDDLEMDEIEKK